MKLFLKGLIFACVALGAGACASATPPPPQPIYIVLPATNVVSQPAPFQAVAPVVNTTGTQRLVVGQQVASSSAATTMQRSSSGGFSCTYDLRLYGAPEFQNPERGQFGQFVSDAICGIPEAEAAPQPAFLKNWPHGRTPPKEGAFEVKPGVNVTWGPKPK